MPAADVYVPWEDFEGSTVVVTGATGLVGGAVADALLAHNGRVGTKAADKIRVVVPARSECRVHDRFGEREDVSFVSWDAAAGECPADPALAACDFIIHCAAPTASAFFVERPVETIEAIVGGTRSMLLLAGRANARMVLASSMEVYGALSGDDPLDESLVGPLDSMSVRSSYPQAKQLAETLLAAHVAEHGTRACVARLAQTFGAGVSADDRRVFAHIARTALAGEDVRLATAGTKQNMYVATPDAVSALLLLAARGDAGCAYNVANEETYCSIRGMAEQVVRRFGAAGACVVVGADEAAGGKYPPATRMRLDVGRLRALGWRPTMDLMDMYDELVASWSKSAGGTA